MNPPAGCLDAETLAAWVDNGLGGEALVAAQSHVAGCARCQAALATLVRLDAAIPVRSEAPDRAVRPFKRWLTWLVPLTAAATAVALWVAVPHRSLSPSSQVAEERAQGAADSAAESTAAPPTSAAASPAPAAVLPASPAGPVEPAPAEPFRALGPAVADKDARPGPTSSPASAAPQVPPGTASPRAAESGRLERRSLAAEPPAATLGRADAAREIDRVEPVPPATAGLRAAPQQAQAAVEAGPARSATANRVARVIEIPSPEPRIRWRIRGASLERTGDGGTAWEAVALENRAELTAGSAVSSTVCWVVGRGGAVYRTIDGLSWGRVPFPEVTDLSGVSATSARDASVSTLDGRTFRTEDAGTTWRR